MIDISEKQITKEEIYDAGLSEAMINLVTKSFSESLLRRQGIRFLYRKIEIHLYPPNNKPIRKISTIKDNLPERALQKVTKSALDTVGINPFAMTELVRLFKQSSFHWIGLRFLYNGITVEMKRYTVKFTSIAGGKIDGSTKRKPIQEKSQD